MNLQDLIPAKRIWPDGIFQVGRNKFSKTWKFTDINYQVASENDKENMFMMYSNILNSFDSAATTKITVNNHRLNRNDFEDSILMPMKGDGLDVYRKEYNSMLLEKATGANGIVQEKYITISVYKKSVEDARTYFARTGVDLTARFKQLGSELEELDAREKLRIFHDFYRQGEETFFEFDLKSKAKLGHDFRDYICPDYIERRSDYIMVGDKYARVLILGAGTNELVNLALSQLGNEGGEKFWRWAGLEERCPWCALFVSWCADQTGLRASGQIPYFTFVTDGIAWFQENDKWIDGSEVDSSNYDRVVYPGMLVFFDWEQDGVPDHVGIITNAANGYIYTVEGNNGDAVVESLYSADSLCLYGFGVVG